MSELDPYILGYRETEQERLERQSDELAPDSEWLFDQRERSTWRRRGGYAEMSGIDRSIGLRVPRLLRASGLVEVRVNPLVHVYPPAHGRRMLRPPPRRRSSSHLLVTHVSGVTS